MKYTTRMIGTVVAFCMAVPVFAQQYKATIPYRMVGEKMIIEMKVNGTARPFIFDTGGRTALTTQACQALQMAATDSTKVTDVNNVESYYKTTRIENLTTPDHVINFKNAPSLVIDEVKGWECFGVDGIIGSDLFANTIVTIDSQAKNIIVTSAEKPSTVSLRKMLNFTKGGGMPIVSVQIAPVSNINVLFDTGSPSLLSLIESDFEKIKPEASMEVVSEGYGEGSIGVSGQADKASSYRVRIPLLSVGATKFRNVGNGLGIRGVTSAKDRSSEDKEERKRNGDGDNRRNLQGNAGRHDYSLLIASRLYGQRLNAGAATLNNRKSRFCRRLELKGEVTLDHIRCVHHVLLSRVLLRTVLSSRADKNV